METLAVHDSVTECGTAEIPVPASGIDRLGLLALLPTVMDPLAMPVTAGERVAVSVFDVPAANVKGVHTAACENPVPEIDTPETLTEVPLVLAIVTGWDAEALTVTLPLLTEAGEADKVPALD